MTQLNPAPYLTKNLPENITKKTHTKKTHTKNSFPFSGIAATLFILSCIYFITIDADKKAAPVVNSSDSFFIEKPTKITLTVTHAEPTPIEVITESTPHIDKPTTEPLLLISDSPAVATIEITQTEPAAFFKQKYHKIVNGDNLWRLARKNYLNPFFWPHIYQANRYSIRNPDKLFTGNSISLPALFGDPENLTPEDRRNIAEGYFLVYLQQKKTNKPFPYYALLGVTKFDPSVIEHHIYEIDEADWKSLKLASN